MFSVMWSEHCSYKSSRPLLRLLPTAGDGVVAGPGENAGVVRIGDGLAVAFKLESHNHPERRRALPGRCHRRRRHPARHLHHGRAADRRPRCAQVRRPLACRARGTWSAASSAGVGGYGNCVGVPTVGGELVFHPSYAENPLVNVMAVGVLEEGHLMRARADRARQPGRALRLDHGP